MYWPSLDCNLYLFATFNWLICRLHGVLPGEFPSSSNPPADGDAVADQRLTLLIAWYTSHTKGRVSHTRLSRGQYVVPRVTRSITWPATLQVASVPSRRSTLSTSEIEPLSPVPSQRLRDSTGSIFHFSPAWERLARNTNGVARKSNSTTLEWSEPPSLRLHFFLRHVDDVEKRLQEEHGIGSIQGPGFPKKKRRRR